MSTVRRVLSSGLLAGSVDQDPGHLGPDLEASAGVARLFEVMRQAVYGQRYARAHGIFKEEPEPTPTKAFHMATRGGARALGLGDRIGTLEVAKVTDRHLDVFGRLQ